MRTMNSTDTHSQSTQNPPPGNGGPPPRRLMRGPDGMIGGVCAGLGRYFGIDPVIVRLLFVAFTFFAFTGAAAYLLLWIILPDARDESAQASPRPAAEPFEPFEWFRAQSQGTQVAVIAGASTMFVVFVVAASSGASSIFWAAPLFIVGVLLLMDRWRETDARAASGDQDATARPEPEAAPEPSTPPPSEESAGPDWDDVPPPGAAPGVTEPLGETPNATQWQAAAGGPSFPEPPTGPGATPSAGGPEPYAAAPRERSVLGQLTLAVTLIVVGVGAALQNLGLIGLQVRDYLAAALVILGLGLLVGSFAGRARWLALIGVAILPFLMVAQVTAGQLPATTFSSDPSEAQVGSWRVGEVRVTPTDVDELEHYRMGAGELHLDLRDLDFTQIDAPVEVSATTLVGATTVIVDQDVDLDVQASTVIGDVRAGDRSRSGFAPQLEYTDDISDEAGTVVLNVDQVIGAIDIQRR